MSNVRPLTGLGISVLVMFIAGCTKQVAPPPPPHKMPPINIFMLDGTQCDVSAKIANVYKRFKHQVVWQSEDGETYNVVFHPKCPPNGTGSPFKDSAGNYIPCFSVLPNTAATPTGQPDTGYFQYTIDHVVNGVATQCKDADPGLNVKD